MTKLNERGSVATVASIAGLSLLLLISLTFGIWAFSGRADYKDNVDKKVADAVDVAKQQVSTEKDNEFLEKEKSPLKTYTGSETFGSLSFQFPKTWSVYAASNSGVPVDNYYNPDAVPGVSNSSTYALRAQVINQSYDDLLKQFDTQIKNGTITANAFRPKLQPSSLGIRLDGAVVTGKTGSMILVPLRDKTIKVWTESSQLYGKDFDNSILPSLNFVP